MESIAVKLIDRLEKVIHNLPFSDSGKRHLSFQVLVDVVDSWHLVDPEIESATSNMTYGIETNEQAIRYFTKFIHAIKKSRFHALEKYSVKLRDDINTEKSVEKIIKHLDEVNKQEIRNKLLGEKIIDKEWHDSIKIFLENEENYLKTSKLIDDYTSLTKKIFLSLSTIQGLERCIKKDEVSRAIILNYLLDARLRNWRCKDESKWGESFKGVKPGELDITIEDAEGNKKAIIECLQLNNGLNRNSIKTHYQKIFKYDSGGLNKNYLVVFSKYKRIDELWSRYLKTISNIDQPYETTEIRDVSTEFISSLSDIRVAWQKYKRSNKELNLFHFMIKMNE